MAAGQPFLDTRDWNLETGKVTEHVQTKRDIQEILEVAGVHPQRRFGQHFLIDGNLMRRLVESVELTPDDWVIEVGPGTGGLTDLLAARAARIIAVEIDRTFYGILVDRFRENENVTLLFGDVLDGKHHLMPELARAIRAGGAGRPTLKLVANLPYQAATPLIMNLLVDFPKVRQLCFTVQAEVGARITAKPGTKDYGPLSILCQSLCTITTIARVGPQCFWPVPHVDSVMLRLDVRETPMIPRDELPGFAALVRAVFDHRRKQLRRALQYACNHVDFSRRPLDFDLSRRPEELAIDEWLALFRALPTPRRNAAMATDRC